MRKPAGFLCALALALAFGAKLPTTVTAQANDLPLLYSDGLQYVGGFRLPAESVDGESFAFGGSSIAFNPAGNSLFVSSYHGAVAEVSIPSVVNGNDVRTLPFASYIQGFVDPTEGHMSEVASGGVDLSGLMVSGNRLYGTASIYYDANNTQRISHFSRSLQLNQPSFSGWSRVSDEGRSGYVSGWMTPLPSEWQARLGGPALTGQCCVPIVWRTSAGPAALAFDPASVGQPVVSATPLLYYPDGHSTLGRWDGSNPTYGATTQVAGLAAIAGTSTVLYFGSNGLGTHCYGNGTADRSLVGTVGPDGAEYCYDPTTNSKGSHAYPYRYQVWAYDLKEFAAVKAGSKQPWEVVPYAVWSLNLPTNEDTFRLGGVTYDAQRQLLYVSQRGADPDGYSSRSVIHVFHVSAAAGSTAPPATTAPPVSTVVTNVSLAADKTAPQSAGASITFTAQPTGGVAPYEYKWIVSDGSASTIAVPWSPSNRFTWTPSTGNANYRIIVWARSSGNTADAFEASTALAFPVTAASSATTTSVTMGANRVAPQPPLTSITWTAVPVGGIAPHQYKWRVFDGATWTVGADWAPSNSFAWTPSAANANYRVEVWVRSAGNSADAQETSTSAVFPIAATATDDVTTAPVVSVLLVTNKPSPQTLGSSITWTATPSGGSGPVVYKWWVAENGAGNTWTAIGGWTSNSTLVWTPTVANPTYRIAVWVKRASNTADQAETAADQSFAIIGATTVTPAPTPTPPAPTVPTVTTVPTQGSISAATLAGDKLSPQPAGTSIHFTAGAVGGTAPYQYQWWVFENQQWNPISTWGASETLTWSRHGTGDYQIKVNVRSAGSTSENGEATFTLRYTLQ